MDLKLIICLLTIGVSWLAYFLLNKLDVFVTNNLHHDEKCEKISLPSEAEDFAIYGNFIISGMGDILACYYKHLSAQKAQKGSLIYIDPKTKHWGYIPMLEFPSDLPFNPLGIDIHNNNTLYAINMAFGNSGERVEVFSLFESAEGIQAKYLRSIEFGNEWLGRLNDIAVIKEGHFYISEWLVYPDLPEGRDHSLLTTIKKMFWNVSGKYTNVLYCKEVQGKAPECMSQAKGYMVNGINKINNQLFVADTVEKSVYIYNIQEDYSLALAETVSFSHHLDNIVVQKDGSILVTGINRMIEFMELADRLKADKEKSPVVSTISRMTKNDGSWKVEEVIVEDKIFAASAVIEDGNIFIGGPTDNFILTCRID
ncbi:unnamed protein product [Blepharisma stoltei]|uniref:Uncharacterized protein n=1 Tax=Blepharisma stoltei TaxID=1481888 RepID=A0AAU9JXP2_9CILI|nr:unnamed protein product [Blepharisma stoltei]